MKFEVGEQEVEVKSRARAPSIGYLLRRFRVELAEEKSGTSGVKRLGRPDRGTNNMQVVFICLITVSSTIG